MTKKVFIYCICLVTVLVGLVGCSKQRLVTSTDITTTNATTKTTENISTGSVSTTTVFAASSEPTTTTSITVNKVTSVTNMDTTKKPVAKTTNKPTPTTTQKPTSQWDLPAQGNEELLKQRIIYYVNKYRAAEGKATAKSGNMPKMQKYADIRVQDLLTDFSHNNDKTQAARDKAQLGKPITEDESYFDRTTNQVIYTGKKITHYNGVCGEAIGFDGGTQSIDALAKQIACGYYESKGHWAYVGGHNATNICVGIKYEWNQQFSCKGWFSVIATCSDSDLPNNES